MPTTPPPYIAPHSHYQVTAETSTGIQALQDDSLQRRVQEIVLRHMVEQSLRQNEAQGIVSGVRIVDMQDGDVIVGSNQDTEQFAASINKLPVSLLVLQDLRQNVLRMNQTMTWNAEDVRAGAGMYDQPGATLSAPLKDVVYDMLNRSGNTAVRILVNYGLGGAAAVNERWGDMPQLSHTYLQPLDSSRFYLGNSTPHDSLWAMQKLMIQQDSYAVFMKDAMVTNIYTDYGVRSQLAGNDWVLLANKVGILDDPEGDNRHDVGIIYNRHTHQSYGYSFMTTSPEANPAVTPQAYQSLADMGRYLLRFAGDRPANQAAKSSTPTSTHTEQTDHRVQY